MFPILVLPPRSPSIENKGSIYYALINSRFAIPHVVRNGFGQYLIIFFN